MKDYSIRQSSCYDNCMLYLLSSSLDKIGMNNPLAKFNYKKMIVENFWNGSYFLDDLSGKNYVAGDANVFPYWTGLINDKNMLRKSIKVIGKAGLDRPFPLKYTSDKNDTVYFNEFIGEKYEGDAIWMHMGLLFVDIVGKVDKKLQQKYIAQYDDMIQKYKNFLEVFDSDGNPFEMIGYYSDDSIIWAANYLTL